MKQSTLYWIIGGVAATLGTLGFVGYKKGWFKSEETKAAELAAQKEAAYIEAINAQLSQTWIKNLKTETDKINSATYAVLVKSGSQVVDQAKADAFGVPTTNNSWKQAYEYTQSLKGNLTIL